LALLVVIQHANLVLYFALHTLTLCYNAVYAHQQSTWVNILLLCTSCLQCFDTVGWAAGRASGL